MHDLALMAATEWARANAQLRDPKDFAGCISDVYLTTLGRLTAPHTSDCAVHNEPAIPIASCSCGAQLKAERKYVAWLGRLVCNQLARWRTQLRSWRSNESP